MPQRDVLRGGIALLITLGSALVGRAYVGYLHVTPFNYPRARASSPTSGSRVRSSAWCSPC
jgi:hypothetical protein